MNDGFATVQALEDATPLESVVFPEGDRGTLTFPQRRCLTRLMKADYLWAQDPNQAADYGVLLANVDLLRSRLNDMFLDLVIDTDRGIAFKVQVRAGDHPVLLRDSAYSREATILLVFLRQWYDSERRSGAEQVFIGRDECRDHVALFRPESATNVSGDRDKVDTAIKFLADSSILRRSSGEDDRFIVSPIIESILPISRLRELLTWLIEQDAPGAASPASASDDDTDEDEEAVE